MAINKFEIGFPALVFACAAAGGTASAMISTSILTIPALIAQNKEINALTGKIPPTLSHDIFQTSTIS